VIAFVVSGLMNKQIAAEAGISEITAKKHRGNAMKKWVRSRRPSWSEYLMKRSAYSARAAAKAIRYRRCFTRERALLHRS
jgi:DNA-binding NarL/FixJ family response regulator